ncbi:MAG: tRNA (adenosine(37)-N6)-threonylcarbamoyltransferase complex dimerization subunit type 1 TsaB [Bdellovibrionales bacterium]
MLVLSLDSASQGCSVCLWRDGVVLALAEETMSRGQDARLIPMVQDVMRESSFDFTQLDRIAVTCGPGSFTGLRIGLAAARGIGFAARKPVLGISRFEIYRAQHHEETLLVALDSRRDELFTKLYRGTAGGDPRLLTLDEVNALGGIARAGDVAGCASLQEPEVVTAASLAAKANTDDPAFLPRPLYCRPPDVTIGIGGAGIS